MIGGLIAGGVAVACAVIAFLGVLYTARTQKEPTIIRVGQEVAGDAIATLIRERDECRAESLVKTDVIAQLNETIVGMKAELHGMRRRLEAAGVPSRRQERMEAIDGAVHAVVDEIADEGTADPAADDDEPDASNPADAS